jgi:hypothetical protein
VYRPGARTDGTSEAVPGSGSVIQDYLRVIAAYVHPDGGRIVVPPPVVSPADPNVQFALTNVSAFKGLAMNWGSDEGADFVLQGSSVAFGADHTARITLHCNDYGGFATVTASRNAVPATPMQVPKDSHNNWIADEGWLAGTAEIDDTNLDKAADADNSPSVSGPPGVGLNGDGFTNFEEYRGFVVRGDHRRTNPFLKDLFVSSNVMEIGILYAYPNLPLATHRIVGQDEEEPESEWEYRYTDRAINFNATNGGTTIPGHFLQSAVRVVDGGFSEESMGITFGISCTGTGGIVPSTTGFISVYTDTHYALSGQGWLLPAILNEMRATMGHEVGHAIHINDRPFVDDPECPPDSANLGTAASIMNADALAGGPAQTDPTANYNELDRAQIRLHER